MGHLSGLFDAWCIILNNGLLDNSEKESEQLDAYYDSLPEIEQKAFRENNWKGVFDLTPMDNDWIS